MPSKYITNEFIHIAGFYVYFPNWPKGSTKNHPMIDTDMHTIGQSNDKVTICDYMFVVFDYDILN